MNQIQIKAPMVLRKIGYALRRKRLSDAELNTAKKSLNNLDDHLAKYLDFTNGFFVEAGANNGIDQSNTYYLEKCFGWKGVLIEAAPEIFEKCRTNRSGCHVENKALVSRNFTRPSARLHYANLMSVVEGAVEGQSEHIQRGLACQNLSETYFVNVPAATLGSILRTLPIPSVIDFFSLDVEGYELEVLDGIDEERFWPRWLLVETSKFEAVENLLGTRYRFVEKLTVHDYLFLKRSDA